MPQDRVRVQVCCIYCAFWLIKIELHRSGIDSFKRFKCALFKRKTNKNNKPNNLVILNWSFNTFLNTPKHTKRITVSWWEMLQASEAATNVYSLTLWCFSAQSKECKEWLWDEILIRILTVYKTSNTSLAAASLCQAENLILFHVWGPLSLPLKLIGFYSCCGLWG